MPRQSSIALLPAHPAEGWTSMDRYWREMQRMAEEDPPDGVMVFSPLGPAPVRSAALPSWRRAIQKYFLYPLRVSRLRADLVHLLDHSYAHLLRHLPKATRSLATAFDLAPLHDSQDLTPAQVARFRKTVGNLTRADRVIAVSHQTKEDLIQFAGVGPGKISVVHPGTDVARFSRRVENFSVRNQLPADGEILLSVGATGHRKNLPFLLQALAPLRDRFLDGRCHFVRAGARLDAALAARFRELLGRGFTELGPCFGDDLTGVYQSASIFLMPSTLEGFSFTMMESMAAGVPVVANRISTNPEAGQDAVLYHENGDAPGAAAQITRLLDDEALWREYRERGTARASQLTWKNHWRGVKEGYRELLPRISRDGLE